MHLPCEKNEILRKLRLGKSVQMLIIDGILRGSGKLSYQLGVSDFRKGFRKFIPFIFKVCDHGINL